MARIKPLMLLPPAIFVVLAGLFAVGLFRDNPDALPSTRVGQVAPDIALKPLGDIPFFDLAALRDGEVKLVNFWASWCVPCRAEHAILTALSRDGVAIYGINYKDDPQDALGFLAELGNPFRAIGADDTGRTAINWGLYGVPETYVIDGAGRVVLRYAGAITRQVLEDTIRPALAQAAVAGGS